VEDWSSDGGGRARASGNHCWIRYQVVEFVLIVHSVIVAILPIWVDKPCPRLDKPCPQGQKSDRQPFFGRPRPFVVSCKPVVHADCGEVSARVRTDFAGDEPAVVAASEVEFDGELGGMIFGGGSPQPND
jgi:hypothetical protein